MENSIFFFKFLFTCLIYFYCLIYKRKCKTTVRVAECYNEEYNISTISTNFLKKFSYKWISTQKSRTKPINTKNKLTVVRGEEVGGRLNGWRGIRDAGFWLWNELSHENKRYNIGKIASGIVIRLSQSYLYVFKPIL